MKITSMTLPGFCLINIMTIPYAFSAQNVSIEQRLNQLELRLQQAENRAAVAEQKNAQLATQLKQTEAGSHQAQQKVEDLETRTQKIEKITPDDNGYFELHGYARSGMMTNHNARHSQGGPFMTRPGKLAAQLAVWGTSRTPMSKSIWRKNSAWIMARPPAL